MGVAGVGKSMTAKHIMISEYMKGTRLIFIDPESEYRELCLKLGGDWINAGGGRGGMLNPLQIRPAPRDEERQDGGGSGYDEPLYVDEGYGMSDMALHIKTLEIFFNLYIPSLSDMQKAILKQAVIELYNSFNIFWDTDVYSLKDEDFPTFSELHDLIVKKSKEKKEQTVYRDLALLLNDIANGSDSFLWNGHTNIEARSRCVCLDTHSFQNTSDNIKRTQYFNLLTWCWEQMSQTVQSVPC